MKIILLLFFALWVFLYGAYFIALSLSGGLEARTLGGWPGVVFMLIPFMATVSSVLVAVPVAIVVFIVSASRKRGDKPSGDGKSENTP